MSRRIGSGSFDLDRTDLADVPDPSFRPGLADLLAPVETPRSVRPGGRPNSEVAPTGIQVLTMRIPAGLYEGCSPLVKGDNRPSWGQLAAWTCMDRADEVGLEIDAMCLPSSRRSVRGQNRSGAAKVQISPRVDPNELAAIERIRQRRVDGLTRTAVVTAALIVARRHPEDYD